jgi:hypothetical protein
VRRISDGHVFKDDVTGVDELLHVEQESPGTIDPPASWPKFGRDIVFEDVTIRYLQLAILLAQGMGGRNKIIGCYEHERC